mmetsp:Transcript_6369/g.18158  ORF Transcript_6369/g.18158 Transcript_6369/m.18158 type:complete len:201 (+) Transcript_6369:1217-1819(+)
MVTAIRTNKLAIPPRARPPIETDSKKRRIPIFDAEPECNCSNPHRTRMHTLRRLGMRIPVVAVVPETFTIPTIPPSRVITVVAAAVAATTPESAMAMRSNNNNNSNSTMIITSNTTTPSINHKFNTIPALRRKPTTWWPDGGTDTRACNTNCNGGSKTNIIPPFHRPRQRGSKQRNDFLSGGNRKTKQDKTKQNKTKRIS